MKLSVYSLKNVLFQGEAVSLNCQTPLGEVTILDNHETLITEISAGPVRVAGKDGKDHLFPVRSGFLEVKPNNEVRCIVE